MARKSTKPDDATAPAPEPAPAPAVDPSAAVAAAVAGTEASPRDPGAAVRALAAPAPESDDHEDGGSRTPSQTPGAIRARKHRARKREGKSAGDGARKGRPSYADVKAERDALAERVRLAESPEDREVARENYRRALAATFTGIGFATAQAAPELTLSPEEVNYIADAWLPVLEMHGEKIARYTPYLSAFGAMVLVYGPKYQRYAERAKREESKAPREVLRVEEPTARPYRPGDPQPTTPKEAEP